MAPFGQWHVVPGGAHGHCGTGVLKLRCTRSRWRSARTGRPTYHAVPPHSFPWSICPNGPWFPLLPRSAPRGLDTSGLVWGTAGRQRALGVQPGAGHRGEQGAELEVAAQRPPVGVPTRRAGARGRRRRALKIRSGLCSLDDVDPAAPQARHRPLPGFVTGSPRSSGERARVQASGILG